MKNTLTVMSMKELVDIYNTVARHVPEMKKATVTTFPNKAAIIKAMTEATVATPAIIAKGTGTDAYSVRQRLRAAQEAGTLKHQRHKHYALSLVDFARVFRADATA